MIILFFIAAGLCGFLIGYSLADRIAEHKLAEMRLEMGLPARPEECVDYYTTYNR